MSSLKGCTHVLRCNWVWCLLGTLKLFRSCPLYFERWNEPLGFLTLLALKIHVVLYCKSADSQQTEGQAPVTHLVWVFQAIKWMAASKCLWGGTCTVKRIYWKGARRGSYTVAGDFPGEGADRGWGKQLCSNVSWEFASLFLSLSPQYLHSLSSIGKSFRFFLSSFFFLFFFSHEAATAQN